MTQISEKDVILAYVLAKFDAIVTIVRDMYVFGYDDAPHGHMEIALTDVRVPAANLIGSGCAAYAEQVPEAPES